MVIGWITRCASCGEELDYPVDPRDQNEMHLIHCDRCNDRFEESMRADYPFGQCPRCGARYAEYTIPCGRCGSLGEILVEPHDVLNPQWSNCPNCGASGEVIIVDGPHEETICGLREYYFPTPTHADVLESAAYRAERDVQWAERLKAYPNDIPF